MIFLFSGYMSPEYAIDGIFSVKSDVFSFGVLVLEIVSGKKNRGFNHQEHCLNLLGHVSIKLNTVFHFHFNQSNTNNTIYIYDFVYLRHGYSTTKAGPLNW